MIPGVNKFVLRDVREFCLCNLDNYPRLEDFNSEYIPTYFKVFIWKVLKCNEILNISSININLDDLQKELRSNISKERIKEIWNFTLPLSKNLKKYSRENFKASSLYLDLTFNGKLKEDVVSALKQSGAHAWISRLSPVTEKIWVASDCTFEEFYDKISTYLDLEKECWDFHQEVKSEIRDQ